MTLRDEIQKTLAENREITERPDFRRLNDFYDKMKKEGVVLNRQYDLPLLDTVGRRLNQEVIGKSRRRR